MKIAVIGLGDITQKAYLPVYAERTDLEVYLVSTDREKAERLRAAYRFAGTLDSIEDVITNGIQVALIHSATKVHAEQAKQLLNAGIHIYIDKPVSLEVEEVRSLTEQATANGLHFITGFNRRFASAHRSLLEVEEPNLIVMQKNRTSFIEDAKTFIFDDFVHVADTLRFLTGRGEIENLQVRGKKVEGLLHHVTIQFEASGITAIGIMNRNNGVTEERVEVMGPNEKRVATDVTSVEQLTKGGKLRLPLDNWEPTLRRRGFVEMIDAFIETIHGRPSTSVTGEDSLATHELCAEVVKRLDEL
ncbi:MULTISPECIES: Gfo/Idh/MocA family oxidoreductase [Exiguobacterium]|uniref:Gfo/Idh/MocA family protein n=1 Tax=Exiguobacterium TaxID=33986 RepID=UPI001BE7BE2B|nr:MULTISPECIES: Gfo/Idh/MocA family oxidoreductase [Exiguobacterium]MCT4792790.1 Gfo/Idh/MocA family oxidoreductase [Exiguobacterium artemiae]